MMKTRPVKADNIETGFRRGCIRVWGRIFTFYGPLDLVFSGAKVIETGFRRGCIPVLARFVLSTVP